MLHMAHTLCTKRIFLQNSVFTFREFARRDYWPSEMSARIFMPSKCIGNLSRIYEPNALPVDHSGRAVHARIVGSNPTQGMVVCMCVYSMFVLFCE
jgi:hypothetical protein